MITVKTHLFDCRIHQDVLTPNKHKNAISRFGERTNMIKINSFLLRLFQRERKEL